MTPDHPHYWPPTVLTSAQVEEVLRLTRRGGRVAVYRMVEGCTPEDIAADLWDEWTADTGLSKQVTRGAMAAQDTLAEQAGAEPYTPGTLLGCKAGA